MALAALAGPALGAPDEDVLGRAQGYPIGRPSNWYYDEHVRVGSFSHLDDILPHDTLDRPAASLPLPNAAQMPRIEYRFEGQTLTIDDFLARERITGLLLIRDGEVLVERYQYDRKPSDRFVSHSMAKSIVSLAIGIALAEERIGSLDDTVAKYVPRLKGCPYGETTIRNILRMSSGVPFSEVYDGKDDLSRFNKTRYRKDSVVALCQFDTREVEQGTRFHYASSEPVSLVLLLREVTGQPLSDYLASRLWQPMGAEADATWAKAPDGTVSGSGNFNATLRDYGRLGMLLANDGMAGGKQIVPKDYLLDATEWHRQPHAFAPRQATPYFGYGYLFWLFPGEKRRFALLGVYGQAIFVDPELKLVLVMTAAAKTANVGQLPLGRERDALWRGVVRVYGSW
ncbi:MAG: serine hydrolase [Bradyrhizobium sp.]|uniref:serine hydrolase domain-containing protein n=1 Tax=Bradyrhizobium sp. TaxID=376 RepID=UPI001DA10FF4|nr:serine hydrolase [Bradyrhizobium sp.]MBV9563040.1 serine hydrolase [Bradyrhizobium sp.]